MHPRTENQNGVAIVEFALIAFVFFLVIFGIIEIALLLFNQQMITNAGREGARHGIVCRPPGYKIPTAEIINVVETYAEDHVVSFGSKNFIVDPKFKSGLNYCDKFQDVLTVDVTYEYSFLVLPFAKKTMRTSAVMVCE